MEGDEVAGVPRALAVFGFVCQEEDFELELGKYGGYVG